MIRIYYVCSHTRNKLAKMSKSVNHYEVLLLLKLRVDINTICIRLDHLQSAWWVPLHLRTDKKLIAQNIGTQIIGL